MTLEPNNFKSSFCLPIWQKNKQVMGLFFIFLFCVYSENKVTNYVLNY